MKYVFISKVGDILPIAQRVEEEGNEVSVYICKDETLIVDKHITEFGPDIIFIDSYGFGLLATRLRNRGFKVIGGSQLTDQLEEDTLYEKRVLKTFGVATDGGSAATVSVEAWFNGKHWVAVSYTADATTTMGERDDRLFTCGLGKLSLAFSKAQYAGVVSLDAHVGNGAVYFNRLRARASSATILAIKEGLKGRLSNLLYTLAYEQNRVFMFKPGWYIQVPIIVYTNDVLGNGGHMDFTVEHLGPEVAKHIWLYGFSKRNQDSYSYHGRSGRVAVVTARGDTIREARRRVYRTAFGVGIPNAMFQKNIGNKAQGVFNKLKEDKWIG